MIRTIIVCAALALSVTAAPAAPTTFDANYMLPGCKKVVAEKERMVVKGPIYEAGVCAGILHMMWPVVWQTCPNDAPNGDSSDGGNRRPLHRGEA